LVMENKYNFLNSSTEKLIWIVFNIIEYGCGIG
jgi:hypothetical protein